MASPATGTFRAHVGERAYDVELTADGAHIDGEPVGVSLEPVGDGSFSILLDGTSAQATIRAEGDLVRVTVGGRTFSVRVQDERDLLLERFGLKEDAASGTREVRAPMPGLVLKVLATEGAAVAAGDGLVVLEAMKMENELRAPSEGVVRKVHCAAGDAVGKNALLVELE